MATNKKISELTSVAAVDGNEAIPVAKNGMNFKVLISQIRDWIGLSSTTQDGLMSKADKAKLTGIAADATKNDTDANLRDRAQHTGSQSVDTISDIANVAKTGAYADLSGKPSLTPASLGCAPADHVGAGGTAHPIASETTAGFMSPAHFIAVDNLADVAVTGDYRDMREAPFLQYASHAGFSWFPNSDAPKGSTFNDYNSFGTGAYVPMAASGESFDAANEYHLFSTDAATYSLAGIRSAQPVVKRGNNARQGGFMFEAVVGLNFVAGSNCYVGVCSVGDPGYGNWGDGDEGIVIGWIGSDAGNAKLQIMTGDGTTSQKIATPVAEALSTNQTVWIRIKQLPGVAAAQVTVRSLNTGALLFDNEVITILPRPDTPLFCIAETGTLTGTASTNLRLFNMSARRWQPF